MIETSQRNQVMLSVFHNRRWDWDYNISDVLNEGAELVVKPEQVYRTMRVCDAAMRSAETGQVEEFDEVK